MKETQIVDVLRYASHAGEALEVAGAGTLLSALPEPPHCRCIHLSDHAGIVDYDPSDLVVTVRAGTRLEDLEAVLSDRGQECPIDGPGSTVGGRVASGLSGIRRLGAGALREWVLGARVITSGGTAVQLGGRTVKNVTGYDLPRLLCGSWGTLGVLTEITLRVRPRPFFRAWYSTDAPAEYVWRELFRPAAILGTRARTHVLLEGHPQDCAEQAARAGLTDASPPALPAGARLSVPPANLQEVTRLLTGEYVAEVGVGIIHADPAPDALPELRRVCVVLGGRLLVLKRGTGIPAFGEERRDAFDTRVKHAFDPAGVLAPWRFAA